MKLIFAFVLITLTAGASGAEHLWVNNITVTEYNMTWSYSETFTGADSMEYRTSIDTGLGNNDSFTSAWELLKADKEMRKTLRNAIDKEPDVRINNETSRVEVLDIDSTLSPQTIGKANLTDTIMNRYNVAYGFKDSILNASSIWFLGQAKTPVTIVMPSGVDVVNTSGMDNITKNVTDHVEISGFFKEVSKDRGEINLSMAKNTSFQVTGINSSNVTSPAPTYNVTESNVTKSMATILSKIRAATIIGAGIIIIVLVYAFKVKRR